MFKNIILAIAYASVSAVRLQEGEGADDECLLEYCFCNGEECIIPIPQATADQVEEVAQVLQMPGQPEKDWAVSAGETIIDELVDDFELRKHLSGESKEARHMRKLERQGMLNHHLGAWFDVSDERHQAILDAIAEGIAEPQWAEEDWSDDMWDGEGEGPDGTSE